MYEIEFTKTAKDQFQKLNKNIQTEIVNKLELMRKNPFVYTTPINKTKYYKFPASQYRVIVDIKQQALIIKTIRISNRSKVYKNLGRLK